MQEEVKQTNASACTQQADAGARIAEIEELQSKIERLERELQAIHNLYFERVLQNALLLSIFQYIDFKTVKETMRKKLIEENELEKRVNDLLMELEILRSDDC